jgi:hypothetical protein
MEGVSLLKAEAQPHLMDETCDWADGNRWNITTAGEADSRAMWSLIHLNKSLKAETVVLKWLS